MRWAGTRDRSWPSKVHVPWSGVSKPVSRLNSVLFPAPLGPMSAVIAPRSISRWSTSTATRPPKLLRTESTTRIGSGLGTPGTGSTSASRSRAVRAAGESTSVGSDGWSVAKGDLLLVAEDALGPEGQHQHQDQPDERQAQGPARLAALEESGQPAVAVELGQDRLRAGEDEL